MINRRRVLLHTDSQYEKGMVVYQMCRDMRMEDNDALLFAQELAMKSGSRLIVNYVIWNYGWVGATRRFYDWVIPSLKEVEEKLRKHNIPLTVTFEDKNIFSEGIKSRIPPSVGAVVIDQLPLRFMKQWKENFLKNHTHVPLYEVDAHNIIPVWELSKKQEFAARTIRPKVHSLLLDFLDEYDVLVDHVPNGDILEDMPGIDWKDITARIVCNEDISGIGSFKPGYENGMKDATHFLNSKLSQYGVRRNDFTEDGQSNLSPYISHGNISRRRIILMLEKKLAAKTVDILDPNKNGSNGTLGSAASFIEELVVRAELSENFSFYNEEYDSYKGFPEWAKTTLSKAKSDIRAQTYTLSQFEKAKTHDTLWNAAQLQMVSTGKMHGYMRMYWAKKILEWSKTPEEAMKIAVYLNDTYELDGRDPNGYVGCAWSIGGLHDRPWFGRPIFGSIRYMAESGVKKHGDISKYVDLYLKSEAKLF